MSRLLRNQSCKQPPALRHEGREIVRDIQEMGATDYEIMKCTAGSYGHRSDESVGNMQLDLLKCSIYNRLVRLQTSINWDPTWSSRLRG